MTPSENRPHRVCRKGLTVHGPVFPTFQAAWKHWRTVHTWQAPFVIVTVETGRVITPETPIVDVNE